MTSLNNLYDLIEAALTSIWMGLAASLIFCFCQYLSERKRRRHFRNAWRDHNPAGRSATAPPAAPSPWNWVAACARTRTVGPETDTFASFGSYFLHHLGRYGFAIASVTVVLIVRWLLEPVLKGSMPFSFFLAAVLFTARTQGIWETLLALVLGFLVGTWFFAQPTASLGFSELRDWWAAGLYFVISIGIVLFLKSEQSARLRTLNSDIAALKRTRESPPERAAHESSQTKRELLANIVAGAHDAILSVTPEGQIMTWNAAAEKILGWSAVEAIGQPLALILSPARQAEMKQITEQVGRGEKAKNWQTTLNGKSGASVAVLITISPVNDPSGGLVGISLIVRGHSNSGNLAGGQ